MDSNSNQHTILMEYNQKIVDLFRVAQKSFKKYINKKSKEFGFTAPQIAVIFSLDKNPGINLYDLSKRLSLSQSTVSAIVDCLVEQGIVERMIPKEDRRSVKLSLTVEFLESFNITKARETVFSDMFNSVPVEELEKIIYGLEKFTEYIGNTQQSR